MVLVSCQSFFVNTPNYGGDLIFNNSMRTTEHNDTFAKQSSHNTGDKLWLNLSDKNAIKIMQIGIAFLNSASDDYNGKEDVKTIINNKTTFYSIAKSIDLIINAQSAFNINKTIPLGITTTNGIGSVLTISIDKKQGIFEQQEIYIYDKLTAVFTEINKDDFTFKVSEAIMDNRFLLVFSKNKSDYSISSSSLVQVYNNKHNVTVISENNKIIKTIEVLDIYTPSFKGLPIATLNNVNKTQENFIVDEKYKILLLVIRLEDGTIVRKKITN
jgi:trimeric autotransporter adhesin